MFRSFDRNNDGSLTQLELGSLLRSLGLKPSPEQLETLTQKADKNSNGLRWKWVYHGSRVGALYGQVGACPYGGGVDGDDQGADTDGDGRINFHEFSLAITSAAFDNSWS
ncbi:putative calcium-binding protein CML17 [Morella rubra]|uniref:Putative calcium-binding protein CML17 n=1 Tax=Morella rubra TaxID=262757 RepID=A0A6A1VSZ0_9ROSI|nr:putative calcium-binding protein CML17 [Morella rubra]